MKYLEDFSVFYDSVYFAVLKFYKELIAAKCERFNKDFNEILTIYNQIDHLSNNIKINNILKPFFYINDVQPSFITYYFTKKIANPQITPINLFSDNKDVYINLIQYFFNAENKNIIESLEESDLKIVNEAILSLNVPNDIKLYLSSIIFNFDIVLKELISTITNISYVIEKYYMNNEYLIDKAKSNINETSLRLLADEYKLDKSYIYNAEYYISIINPWVNNISSNNLKQIRLLLGKKFIESINGTYYCKYMILDLINLILYDANIRKVCEYLAQTNEMNLHDLAKKLCALPDELNDIFFKMRNNGIIIISRTTDKNVYYKLNIEFFKHSKKIILDIIPRDVALKYLDLINSILLDDASYFNIIEILSNKYMVLILNIIKEYKELNSAKIIELVFKKYKCSNSTVYRLITKLLEYNAIFISKKEKHKTYYAINTHFFEQAEISMSEYLSNYTKLTM